MLVLILILGLELYLLSRILKYFLLSPIYLYVIFSLLSIISTVLYFHFYDDKFSLYNLDEVTAKSFFFILKKYIMALCSFILGVIIYYDLSLKKTRKLFNRSFTDSLFVAFQPPLKLMYFARGLFIIILLLFAVTYGTEIFLRQEYLPETNRGLTVLIKIFSFIEVIILALLNRKYKIETNTYFFTLILISLGTGSRSVFLYFLVYFCILFVSRGNTITNKVKFSFNVFLSFVFLAYLMQLRMLDSHGVLPYIKSIASSGADFVENFYFNIYYSLIFGVYVTIGTFKDAIADWNIIFVSLNPLPGSIAGWYNYADDMRLNIYAPYSLHGRIFKMGNLFSFIYFFLTGIIFSFMEMKVRSFLNRKKRIFAFIIVLLLILHIVYGFEYNLRSAFRYIYYAFFLIALIEGYYYLKPILLKTKL